MRFYLTVLVLMLAGCAGTSSTTAEADVSAVRVEIEALNDLWACAYVEGTTAAVVPSIFAEDFVRIAAGPEPLYRGQPSRNGYSLLSALARLTPNLLVRGIGRYSLYPSSLFHHQPAERDGYRPVSGGVATAGGRCLENPPNHVRLRASGCS